MGSALKSLVDLHERRRRAGLPFDGAELRTRREMLGYSRLALARRWGTTESTLYRWENGLMPLEKSGMVADALCFLESLSGRESWVRTGDGELHPAAGRGAVAGRKGRGRRKRSGRDGAAVRRP